MKKIFTALATLATMSLVFIASPSFGADSFKLTSPQLSAGSQLSENQVFNGFGCMGKNISPELHWTGEPATTKSFAVTVYDPDAPTGSGWWHWVVFNIPASEHSLILDGGNTKKHLLPDNFIQSMTDFGTTGYGGACPPEKDSAHHYEFTVWALDTDSLPLKSNAPAAMVGFYIHQHQVGEAKLTATYDR